MQKSQLQGPVMPMFPALWTNDAHMFPCALWLEMAVFESWEGFAFIYQVDKGTFILA